jgi:hypothetical protein
LFQKLSSSHPEPLDKELGKRLKIGGEIMKKRSLGTNSEKLFQLRNFFSSTIFAFRCLFVSSAVFFFGVLQGGCSGAGSGGSGSIGSGAIPSIVGLVSQAVSGSSIYKPQSESGVDETASTSGSWAVEARAEQERVRAMAESNCIVEARKMEDNSLVATATTGADGKYTLKGVDTGTTYRITAVCGSNSYSVVATAVTQDPSSVGEDKIVPTNPRSTVIAAHIIKTVLESVSEATSGLPAGARAAVKQAILRAMDSVIQTITVSIEEAIKSGSMEEPTINQAKSVADALKDATDSTTAGTAISAAPAAPASVDQALTGAKNQGVAQKACDSTISGSDVNSCIRSVARLTFNVLGFGVGLKTSGGAFGTFSGCSASATVSSADGGANLGSVFPNADFVSGSGFGVGGNQLPVGYCFIRPRLAAPDRNRGYENEKEDHGPVFAETGDLDGNSGNEDGVLTALGNSIFSGHRYNLRSLDRMIFTRSNGAGFDARLISRRFLPGSGTGSQSFFYLTGNGASASWSDVSWQSNCRPDGSGPGNGTSPCELWSLNLNWGNPAGWSNLTTAGGQTWLRNTVGASNFGEAGVMLKKFGGLLPTQAQLDSFIDEGRTHLGRNITGEKEIYVVTDRAPNFGGAPGSVNPCFDQDASTPCVDSAGNAILGVRVDLALGAADSSSKVRPITSITRSNSGAFYMRPYFGPNGFNGVVGFIKVSDGRIVRDELMRDRAVKIVLQSSECNANGLPTSAAGCEVGDLFNALLDWSTCGSSSGSCPGYSAFASEVSRAGSPAFSVTVTTNSRAAFKQYCTGTPPSVTCRGHQVLAAGNWGQMLPFKVQVTASGTGQDSVSIVMNGSAPDTSELQSGQYNIGVRFTCSTSGCNRDNGYYLVDSAGNLYVDANDSTVPSATTVHGTPNVGIYTASDISGDFDSNTAGTQNVDSVTTIYNVQNGPVRNPNFKCEAEPFFIDGNGNGRLDCELVGGFSQASLVSGDRSFSSQGEYQNYINAPGLSADTRNQRQNQTLRPRQNSYEFGDPVGTKKLLSLAFNGWFNGATTLDANTQLNGLQKFALLYLFMSTGNEGMKEIGNWIPNQSRFMMITPGEGGNGMTLGTVNDQIGKGFSEFRLTN